jgi:hypothetical protein
MHLIVYRAFLIGSYLEGSCSSILSTIDQGGNNLCISIIFFCKLQLIQNQVLLAHLLSPYLTYVVLV